MQSYLTQRAEVETVIKSRVEAAFNTGAPVRAVLELILILKTSVSEENMRLISQDVHQKFLQLSKDFEVGHRFISVIYDPLPHDLVFTSTSKHRPLVRTAHLDAVMERLNEEIVGDFTISYSCLLYTSPSPRDRQKSRMPSSA